MSQVQFYKAYLMIPGNSKPIPVRPGAVLSVPENYSAPPIIGNYWMYNYQAGFQQPVLTCQLAVRDVAGEALSAAFWSSILARTSDSAHDTVSPGAVTFWDGATGFQLNGAKFDAITLSTSKGDDINMSLRIVAASITPLTGSFAYSGTFYNAANMLRFQSVNFTAPVSLSSVVWQFEMNFWNNHTPNNALNGSVFPVEMNAGMMSCSLNIFTQASDWAAIPIKPVLPSTAWTPITFTITGPGSGSSCTVTLNNPIDNTDNNRGSQAPRVMRQHSYICAGGDGDTIAPISVTSTF